MSDFREHARNHLRTAAGTYIGPFASIYTIGRKPDIRCVMHRGPQCGQTGLMQMQPLLTLHLFAFAAMVVWRRSIFHRSGRSNRSTAPNLKLTFRYAMHELTCRGTKRVFAAAVPRAALEIERLGRSVTS